MGKYEGEALNSSSDSDASHSSGNETKTGSSHWKRIGLLAVITCLACGFAVGTYRNRTAVQTTSGIVKLQGSGGSDVAPAGADNADPVAGATDCNCMQSWTFRSNQYQGCASVPAYPGQNWCYVVGGAKCLQSQASVEPGETKRWRDCDACNCMPAWDWKGKSYAGCAVSPDFPNQWCYVQGGPNCKAAQASDDANEKKMWRECTACNCMSEWNYNKKVYQGCAETENYPGKPWCYVQGAQNCKQASASEVVGEAKTWRLCSACNCQDQWEWKGSQYKGCSATPDVPGETWCFVQGGPHCNQGQNVTFVTGDKRKWRNCQACNCMDAWNYKGVQYKGCDTTPGFPESNWCYVQGGDSCPQGLPSEEPGEKKKWRACGTCNCKAEWNYKEQGNDKAKSMVYKGCATTPGFGGKWCYINGNKKNCADAKDSLDKAEPRFWRKCYACSCMDQWNFNGNQYKGCATPPGKYTKSWCYVQGGEGCSKALDSEVKGEQKKWMDCKPCACMEHWDYKGKNYKACAKTEGDDYNWCYVIGEKKECDKAQDSEFMASKGEQRKWRKCGPDKEA